MDLALASVSLDDPDAQALIGRLNAELEGRYPEAGANHFRLDPEEVAPGRGAFLVARRDGRPVACGAVRLIEPGTAEIKRMYTRPEARGLGLGRRMVMALEEVARTLGAVRLLLETGERQVEALALYERLGFRRCERYGEYVSSPLSVCMEKTLHTS